MFMRAIHWMGKKAAYVALVLMACWMQASAYTVVTVSTAAPVGLEKDFIAQTTAQYAASVFVNPFVANTYQVQLFGPNPSFNPPPSNADLLNALVSVDSYTYVYGWGDGESFERYHDLGYFTAPIGTVGMLDGGFFVNCSSPTYWNNIQYSSDTFQLVSMDSTTCNAVLSGVYNFVYQQYFSTPTVVPGFVQ